MTMTSTPLATRVHDGAVADDDPAARPRRRAFTAEYKLAILEQYDRLEEPGAKVERLRRQNERLQAELGRTKAALEIMGRQVRASSRSGRPPTKGAKATTVHLHRYVKAAHRAS